PRPGQRPDVPGPLVHHADLLALPVHRHHPAAPAGPFQGEGPGPPVHRHDDNRNPIEAVEAGRHRTAVDGHLITVHRDLDLAAVHRDEVLHRGTSRATDSTWAVWGKRSKARTSARRYAGSRPMSRARAAGSQQM